MIVLQSLNAFLYNSFYGIGMNDALNIALNFVINALLSLGLTWLSAKTVTPLTNYLCGRVGALLCGHTEK